MTILSFVRSFVIGDFKPLPIYLLVSSYLIVSYTVKLNPLYLIVLKQQTIMSIFLLSSAIKSIIIVKKLIVTKDKTFFAISSRKLKGCGKKTCPIKLFYSVTVLNNRPVHRRTVIWSNSNQFHSSAAER